MIRGRGYTMAFYAAFLAAVGLPLLALCVDVTRMLAGEARLRNATEAACAAYANGVDVRAFVRKGEIVFEPEAAALARQMFRAGAPEGAELGISVRSGVGGVRDVDCQGEGRMRPLIDIGVGGYRLRHATTAKVKFGEIVDWK